MTDNAFFKLAQFENLSQLGQIKAVLTMARELGESEGLSVYEDIDEMAGLINEDLEGRYWVNETA